MEDQVFIDEVTRLSCMNPSLVPDINFKDVIAREITGPSSRLKELIIDTQVDRFAKQLTASGRNKKKIFIKTSLTPDQCNALSVSYPEYQIEFLNCEANGHPFANASRKLENQLLLDYINYSPGKSTGGRDVYVNDVGGNWVTNLGRDMPHCHTCAPILDLYDATRESTRIFTAVTSLEATEERSNRFKSPFFRCKHKAQDCDITAVAGICLHSSYDIRLIDIGDIMRKKKMMMLYGTMVWSPEMLYSDKGIIPLIRARYVIDKQKNIVSFSFEGDSSFNYVHSLTTYLSYITVSVFYDSLGCHYSLELLNNRCGVQFFKVTPLLTSGIPRRTFLTHCIWFDARVGKKIVTYYTIDEDAIYRKTLPLKLKTLIIPNLFYQRLEAFALNLEDNKFTPKEVFSYARSLNERMVMNGKDVMMLEPLASEDLLSVANAVYIRAFIVKFNEGRVAKGLITMEKAKREFAHNGILKLLWSWLTKSLARYEGATFDTIFNIDGFNDDNTKSESWWKPCDAIRKFFFRRVFPSDSTIRINDPIIVADFTTSSKNKVGMFRRFINTVSCHNGQVDTDDQKDYLDFLKVKLMTKEDPLIFHMRELVEKELHLNKLDTTQDKVLPIIIISSRLNCRIYHSISTLERDLTSQERQNGVEILACTPAEKLDTTFKYFSELVFKSEVNVLHFKEYIEQNVDKKKKNKLFTSYTYFHTRKFFKASDGDDHKHYYYIFFYYNDRKQDEDGTLIPIGDVNINDIPGDRFVLFSTVSQLNYQYMTTTYLKFKKILEDNKFTDDSILEGHVDILHMVKYYSDKIFELLEGDDVISVTSTDTVDMLAMKYSQRYYSSSDPVGHDYRPYTVEDTTVQHGDNSYFVLQNTTDSVLLRGVREKLRTSAHLESFDHVRMLNMIDSEPPAVDTDFFDLYARVYNINIRIYVGNKYRAYGRSDIQQKTMIPITRVGSFYRLIRFNNIPTAPAVSTTIAEKYINIGDLSHLITVMSLGRSLRISEKFDLIGSLDSYHSSLSIATGVDRANVSISYDLKYNPRVDFSVMCGDYEHLLNLIPEDKYYKMCFFNDTYLVVFNRRVYLGEHSSTRKYDRPQNEDLSGLKVLDSVSNTTETLDFDGKISYHCMNYYMLSKFYIDSFDPANIFFFSSKKNYDLTFPNIHMDAFDDIRSLAVEHAERKLFIIDHCNPIQFTYAELAKYLDTHTISHSMSSSIVLMSVNSNFLSKFRDFYLNKYIRSWFTEDTRSIRSWRTNITLREESCKEVETLVVKEESISEVDVDSHSLQSVCAGGQVVDNILLPSGDVFKANGDGNCLYYSLLASNDIVAANTLKKELLAHALKKNNAGVVDIISNGKWGDTSVIEVFVDLHRQTVCVHVEDHDGSVEYHLFSPPGVVSTSFGAIHLLFKASHYDRLLKCVGECKIASIKPVEGVVPTNETQSVVPGDSAVPVPDLKDAKPNERSQQQSINTVDESKYKLLTIDQLMTTEGYDKSQYHDTEKQWRKSRVHIETRKIDEPLYSPVVSPVDYARNAAREQVYYYRMVETRISSNCKDVYTKHVNFPITTTTKLAFSNDAKSKYMIYDLFEKKFLTRVYSEVINSEACYDGNRIIPIHRTETGEYIVTTDARLLLFSAAMVLLNDTRLYNATEPLLGNLNDFVLPKMNFIQGVPGCGKTTYILTKHKPSRDLVLTATREAAEDIRERLNTREVKSYTTSHSYLINSDDKYDTVWFDEVLMRHPGEVILIAIKSGCKVMNLLGDRHQIPFIDRSDLHLRFDKHEKIVSVAESLNTSYRCPYDVAMIYNPVYSDGFHTTNPTKSTIEVVQYSSPVDIPLIPGAKYLVFKQSEKSDLASRFDVSTVHEYQGKQAEIVVIIRDARNKNLQDSMYNKDPWILVAFTRHTKKCYYYTPVRDQIYKKFSQPVEYDSKILKSVNQSKRPQLAGGFNVDVDIEVLPLDILPTAYTHNSRDFFSGHFVDYTDGHEVSNFLVKERLKNDMLRVERRYIPQALVADPLSTFQTWYDHLLPGNSTYDLSNDQLLSQYGPFHFEIENARIDMSKYSYVTGIKDSIRPHLRTSMPVKRQPTTLETILAVVKRNLNVPELEGDVDNVYMSQLMYENFLDTYISPIERDTFDNYKNNPIHLNSTIIQSWLLTQPTNIKKAVKNLDSIFVSQEYMHVYSLMNKNLPKPSLTTGAPYEYAALQTIAYQPKEVNVVFCTMFRELKLRLLRTMHPKFIMYTDKSPQDLADELTEKFFSIDIDELNKLEIDISKYDKSQGYLALLFELKLYEALGLSKELLDLWFRIHLITLLRDRSNGFSVWILLQRKSGDAATWFGNTVFLMAVIAMLFDLSLCVFALFSGDDSVLFSHHHFSDLNSLCAFIFNLESKFYSYQSVYFCSKFLFQISGVYYFVPDPLKLITKLGRSDLVNYEHLKEYWTSLCDLCNDYRNAYINDRLSRAINERYPSGLYSHDVLFMAINTILKDFKTFSDLYYLPEGFILSQDPTRPSLD